jgi:hypothetical protein
MSALAFVYLGSIAVAAPLHMLDGELTGEAGAAPAPAAALAPGAAPAPAAALAPGATASGWAVAEGGRTHDHGSDPTGELPEAPHDHSADCLTCGLLVLPVAEAVGSPPAQVPGVADAVFPPRGLALSHRAVVNPRLRGPPVT